MRGVLTPLCPGCEAALVASDVLCPRCGLVQVPADPLEALIEESSAGRRWGARTRSAQAGLPAEGAGSLASAPRRALAATLDLLTLLPLWATVVVSEGGVQVLAAMGALLASILYETLALRVRGATLGRILCGVRVVPVAGVGSELVRDARGWPTACSVQLTSLQIPWGRALLRAGSSWGMRAVGAVVPGLAGLAVGDACWAIIHPWQQSWHDLLGTTVVVRTRRQRP